MYKIEGNKLITEERTFTFSKPIIKLVELNGYRIILLGQIATADCINNVYAIRGDRIAWQVQDPIHYNLEFTKLRRHLGGYSDLEIYQQNTNLLILTNSSGDTFLVNPENGAIVGQGTWVK